MPDDATFSGEIMLDFLSETLRTIEKSGNLRRLPEPIDIESGAGILNLSSNDYLGLAADKELRQGFLEKLTVDDFRPSSSSSRLLTGNSYEYIELETLLARLYGTEAALVFNSGYHMNIGILPAIADPATIILADKLVHASLIDGIRLARAKFLRYRHNDYDQLEELMETNRNRYRRFIVVTESIFSMDGDEADLVRLMGIKARYGGVVLYVDEAHAVGVRGAHGLGLAEELGCMGGIDILAGTFGKALASLGGFIVCREALREYLVNTMRPLIFTTGLPPINLRWTRHVLERLGDYDHKRRRLGETGRHLHLRLAEKGYQGVSPGHIQPIILGESRAAVAKAAALRERGFHVLPVRPPTVPEGTSRLRISLTADIGVDDVERMAGCL